MPPPQGSSRTQGRTAGDLSGLEVTCRSNRRRWGRAKGGGHLSAPLRLVYWILYLHVPEATKASICTICKMVTSVQTSQKMGGLGLLLNEALLTLLFTADPVLEAEGRPTRPSPPPLGPRSSTSLHRWGRRRRSKGLAPVSGPPKANDGTGALPPLVVATAPGNTRFHISLNPAVCTGVAEAHSCGEPAAPHTSGVVFTPYLTRLRSPSAPQPSEG